MILFLWTYIGWTALGLLGLLLIVFIISHLKLRIVQKKQRKRLHELFDRHNMVMPKIEFGSVYWWPTFTIIFSSESEYIKAEQLMLFEEFRNIIQGFYDAKYDPKQGVQFTYFGQKRRKQSEYYKAQ